MFHRRSKIKLYLSLVAVLFVFIGIGYAYLTTTLDINGSTKIAKNTWNIHFENIRMLSNTNNSAEPTISSDNTIVTFSPTLSVPGDSYEFTVDVVNTGTINAMVSEVIKSGLTEDKTKYASYTAAYSDGSEIKEKDLLAAGETETFRITVKYRNDLIAQDLPTEDQLLNLTLTVNYIQDDGTSISRK